MQSAMKPFLALTAGDLMTAPVMTLPQDMSLREAARLLCRSNISGAPIVDTEGRCLGVLSSSDFVSWAGKGGESEEKVEVTTFIAPWGELINIEDSPDMEIRHYMTARPVTVAATTPIGELAQKMVDAHIHRVLVVSEQHRPCGIVTSTDVLAAVAQVAKSAAQKSERQRPRVQKSR